jgi:hypothetical protein
MAEYQRRTVPAAARDQRVIITAGAHCQHEESQSRADDATDKPVDGNLDLHDLYLRWFDHWLRGQVTAQGFSGLHLFHARRKPLAQGGPLAAVGSRVATLASREPRPRQFQPGRRRTSECARRTTGATPIYMTHEPRAFAGRAAVLHGNPLDMAGQWNSATLRNEMTCWCTPRRRSTRIFISRGRCAPC